MTVPATARRAGPFSGNGVTTSFPFTFKVFAKENVQVVFTSTDGLDTTLVLDSNYSIALNGDQDATPGGTITYPISGAALAVGESLSAVGALEYEQTTDLPTGGAYRASVVEDALDRATIQIQQLAELADRALTLPPSSTADPQLPAPEPDKFIGWNTAGDALVNRDGADLATVVIAGTAYTNVFNGTGAQTAFVLTADPGSVNALDIAISGVSQVNGVDFTVSGTTLTFTAPPPAGTGNIAVRYVAAIPVSSAAAANVSFTQQGTGAVATDVDDVLRRYVHVDQFGAVGDNVADDYTPIMNAAARAVALGVPLHFDGTKNYRINQAITILPAGLRMQTNGATFTFPVSVGASSTLALQVQGPGEIDEINAVIPTGALRNRAIAVTGNDMRIGAIRLTSTDIQLSPGALDAGVRLSGCVNVFVGLIDVANYDRAVYLLNTTDCTVMSIQVESYVRAVYIHENTRLYCGRSTLKTRSPNASNLPGHNGVILATDTNTQNDVTLDNWAVLDAGEHAIRVGGGGQSGIRIIHPIIRNAGNCGIKILGTVANAPTIWNKTVVIDSPVIEDVGTSASTAENRCGILIQHADDVQIISPIIRPRDNAVSAAYGILIDGSTHCLISNPFCRGATFDGIYLFAENGDNNLIQVNGGLCINNGRYGIHVQIDATRAGRRMAIDGLNCDANTNVGFRINNAGTFIDSLFRIKVQGNTAGAGSCNSTSALLDIYGLPGATALAGITAQNGSRWSDQTTLNIRKGGAWVAL